MKHITEDKVREIHTAHPEHLSRYPREQLQLADEWVKRFALRTLDKRLRGNPKPIREFVKLMARCHYGSAETDAFLTTMACYPEWMS